MGVKAVITEALVVTLGASAMGIVVNALRPEGLPLVAHEEYEVFVPCPEPLGVVGEVGPDDPIIRSSRTIVLDARDDEAFKAWHEPGARHVPFDYLSPVPDETIRSLARSGASAIVVYGDGEDPDSGRELARELAGRGLKNVSYVPGGAPALRMGDG